MYFRLLGVAAACAALAPPAFAADLIRLSTAQRQASSVRVERVTVGREAASSATLALQGYAVLPPQAVETVSAPLSGFVQSVRVAPTDRLRAGQAVATLHSTELLQGQREFIQLESQAQQAQDRLQRSERLLAEGIVAESRVREDRYTHTQAQVALKERRQALQLAGVTEARLRVLSDKTAVQPLQPQLSVSTPRDGTVLEVMATAGQRVEAGAPLLTLARSGLLALELQATPSQSQHIQPGATVTVTGCPLPGRVRGLASLMRGGNQAVTVHVDMPVGSTCLRPNQAIVAEVVTRMANASSSAGTGLSIPASALFQHGGVDHLFVQEGEGFRATPVQVQSRSGERAQLVGGVKADDVIAIQGIATLKAAWLGMGEDTSGTAATAGKP